MGDNNQNNHGLLRNGCPGCSATLSKHPKAPVDLIGCFFLSERALHPDLRPTLCILSQFTMFLSLPYMSLLFFIVFICGTILNIISVSQLIKVSMLLGYDEFKRHLVWLRDVRIVLVVFYVYCIALLFYDLLIAFRTTRQLSAKRVKTRLHCVDSGVVQKILYAVNHVTLLALSVLTSFVLILFFVMIVLKSLCIYGSRVPINTPIDPFKQGVKPGEMGQALDMREFTPLVGLRTNETMYLYFESDRLKKLCDDYVSVLYLHTFIYFVSSAALLYSMLNMVINYSSNIQRCFAKRKLEELHKLHSLMNSDLEEME